MIIMIKKNSKSSAMHSAALQNQATGKRYIFTYLLASFILNAMLLFSPSLKIHQDT